MTSPLARITKDPQATLDYVVDWSKWLETSSNDVVSSVVWIVPNGLVKTTSAFTDTTATVWLSGGVLGRVYTITCRVTTLAGRTQDYSFQLICQDR
jgi:hypothetical protein